MALTDNILAYYKLDADGTDVSLVDSTGNGYTLTNNGSVALGVGKINGDATFDGSAQYLSNSSVATNFGTGGFSVSCWLRLTQYSDPFCIPWLIADPRVLPTINSSGLVSLIVGGSAQSESTGYVFPLNTWTHICFVRNTNNGNLDFYINGSFASSFTLGNSEIYSSGQLLLGTANDNLGSFVPIGGLDEVGIWSRALTPNEVYNLYYLNEGNSYPFSKPVIEPQLADNILAYWKLDNNGSGGVSLVDSTGNSNTLTNNGSVALGTGKIEGCGVFDGTNDLNGSFPALTSNYSVSLWVNPNDITNQQTFFSSASLNFYFVSDGIWLNNWASLSGIDGVGTFSTGTWVNFCIIKSGGTVYLYANGSLLAQTDQNIYLNTLVDLGAGNGQYFFNGSIDEVGIWSRALSSTEVTTLYNGGSGVSYPFVPSLYFNAAVNGSLTTLGNWWKDSSFTIPATALPNGGSAVFIYANVTSGTGSYAFATINSASIGSSVSITASSITLNGTSSNAGTLVGVTTLNNTASNTGTITGATTLNNTASNAGTITGNATIYYPSANQIGGVVSGTETYIWPNGTGLWGNEVWIDGSSSFIIPEPSDVRSGVEYGPAEDPYVGTYSGGGGTKKAISISQLLKLPFPINI